MKLVSIQDLKARLSAIVAEAESGDTIIITRHNVPVAQMSRFGWSPSISGGT
jgi:antitoxin (DNA-binding transcriptional repressor) of toxin-antitoxin stability system